MENLEKSNPVLKILKYTKFGITDSIVRGANLLTYSSYLEPFVQSLKDIGAENCVLPEKLVKYKVCTQNKFRSNNKHLFDDVFLRPICSGDIECLEREIQDTDRVLMEKRKILQSMRNDISTLNDDSIPKLESELQTVTRQIEVNLANFIEVNEELTTQNNALHQSKQKLVQSLTVEGEQANVLYASYDFESSLYHLLHRMNTDFNVLCKHVNTNTQITSDEELEFDIEMLGKSLSHLRTDLEEAKCLTLASEMAEEKLLAVRKQLEAGSFKHHMFGKQVTSSQQLRLELKSAWSKILARHSSQQASITQAALRSLYEIRISSLDSRIQLLASLGTGMSCMLSVKNLLTLLVELELDQQRQLIGRVFETHGMLDQLYGSIDKQKTNLKQLLKTDSSQAQASSESTAQAYAKLLIGQAVRLDPSTSLEAAVELLRERISVEKQRIGREYSALSVHRKLAPLRQQLKDKSAALYSGPTRVPALPYRPHNDLIISRNLHLSKLKAGYDNLMREIRARTGDLAHPTVSKHHSLWSDSGIESRNNLSV